MKPFFFLFLQIALIFSLCGFAPVDANTPIRIGIDGEVFTVDNSGITPIVDGVIARFVPNVYIAHDVLAGRYFNGDNVIIQYASGKSVEYKTVEIIILQAIPQLDGSYFYTDGIYIYTSDDLHHRIFPRGVVFVTCITKYGIQSWGRKFIVMKPVNNEGN